MPPWIAKGANVRHVTHLARGMNDMSLEAAPLKFHNLFDTAALASLPTTWGHDRLGVEWSMYGNDRAGNCVDAGGEHEHMYWCLSTNRQLPRFTNTSLQNYSDMLVDGGGKPYNPKDRKTDTGLDPIKAADWRVRVGFLDDAGARHKNDAYAATGDLNHAFYASYALGVCGFGFAMPANAEQAFADNEVWSDTSGKSVGGHYVPLVGRNSRGYYVFISWGAYQAATPAWVEKYFVGAVAYINQEYIKASGVTPEGLNSAALEEYLASLR